MSGRQAPRLRHCFTIRALVEPLRPVGLVQGGQLIYVPIRGGHVRGSGLDGEVLPGGGDWAILPDEWTVMVEARYQFRTASGAVVDVVNTGVGHIVEPGTPQVDYFATRPVFRVENPDLQWLVRTVFVGWARSSPDHTEIDVYAVDAPEPGTPAN